ncbi:hypothetical protein QJU89_04185 [Pasteurella skyensis]|uniref:Uncharacterized protein n=1 Tax=Phocoenobacter skyensis TaxID=97481 RepID=A0AAJ6P016_9PAST|nr:hypothetical protein [Pasteurella skyensis]MDP8162033.1 hypothetical protein [Pasteurella skyensis]MDP8172189.1 hypothetical protein [Pasteurella skyensis]MDP8176463.1 hypothetical protein [Pasteurella skyensis]MDP8178351.1 hypothetical protein [Pasteurella skyensis]MDP8182893.1 hypothetical protein [Pasteurella skyensis]
MKWLRSYYLQPKSYIYLFINYLLKHPYVVGLFIGCVILSYPAYDFFNKYTIRNTERTLNNRLILNQAQLDKQLKTLNVLVEGNDIDPLAVNKKIKEILTTSNMNIESVLWDKESNVIDVVFHQTFENVYDVIKHINQINHISFNEISLIKLKRNNFIQCILSLSILEKE